MTGELQETVAPCGAITEKRPSRLSGCVGVFFQLFDWNRRFSKKKLFSRKSLLPGKQASKRFGGNDKLLKSKLNLIDDEKRGSFPNRGEVVDFKRHEMRPPSLVARLMGLESIPSNHKKKKKSSHLMNQDKDKCLLSEEEEEEEDSGLDKSRPQKMQRTIRGVCDRRVMVKKFGSDAMQIKNVLTRVRKHHHQHQNLASPVKSPRLQRRNSRLINAAARILEPGKRNSKYNAIAYPSSSRTIRCGNVGKETAVSPDYNTSVASCKACGSFVDVHGSSSVPEESGKSMVCVSESTPFERSKRSVHWRNQEPSMPVSGKGRGCIDQMERKALHRARFPPVPESYTLQRSRGSSSPANAINYKDKDFIAMNRGSASRAKFENSGLNLQRRSHTRIEESCNRSGLNTCARKRRPACETAFSPLKLGSPQRDYSQCCRETKERKRPPRVPNQMGQKRIQVDAGTVGLIQQKLEEITSQEEDALPSKPASLILHELLSSLAREQTYSRDVDNRKKGKTEMWSSIGNANSDYTSPGSVLDASFSNESCFSNSFDNISVPGQMRMPLEPVEPDWDVLEDSATLFKNSTSVGNYQAITSLVSHVSNVLRSLSNTGLILTLQRFTNAREVIIHTELLAAQDNYLIGQELFDELMIYAARSDNLLNLPGITGGFLVDAMVEHLEEINISCGLKPSSAEASELIQGVLGEVPKWAALARVEMDEVVGIEMEKWMDLETHLFGVGSEIAYEIVMCLVEELAMDLL
ncbi:hypothetical protein HID58_046739 [Brassica napus]|uniref:DUF3741 domain-containing protein n=2 Tax=Brassica napus TaxID=3708 RepID=A0ABQ8AYS5_BRANA|nr:uncharacterized protein LOC106381071 isoform X1 [Brassica napus]XP_013676385.1 uncharacterized protein LOC106381071 isoform X1 [Brassica napus]KAH0897171.1 hypothetical protein HID58_046739 [Brassica napus]